VLGEYRSQEVAGSSPASSIKVPACAGVAFTAPATRAVRQVSSSATGRQTRSRPPHTAARAACPGRRAAPARFSRAGRRRDERSKQFRELAAGDLRSQLGAVVGFGEQVSVGVEGDARARVADDAADLRDVEPQVDDQVAGERVPQVVEAQPRLALLVEPRAARAHPRSSSARISARAAPPLRPGARTASS
jgi:hypothetical protein